jgi:hypothetical protein
MSRFSQHPETEGYILVWDLLQFTFDENDRLRTTKIILSEDFQIPDYLHITERFPKPNANISDFVKVLNSPRIDLPYLIDPSETSKDQVCLRVGFLGRAYFDNLKRLSAITISDL